MSLFRFEWYMHRRFLLELNNAAWAPATADQNPNENSGLYLTDRHYSNKSARILQDIKEGFRRKFLWPFSIALVGNDVGFLQGSYHVCSTFNHTFLVDTRLWSQTNKQHMYELRQACRWTRPKSSGQEFPRTKYSYFRALIHSKFAVYHRWENWSLPPYGELYYINLVPYTNCRLYSLNILPAWNVFLM